MSLDGSNRPKSEEVNADTPSQRDGPITLNVGGRLFTTTRGTLCSMPNTMLSQRFAADSNFVEKTLSDGSHFIDADPRAFDAILRGLRLGNVPSKVPRLAEMDQDEWEATLLFYGIAVADKAEEIQAPKSPPPRNIAERYHSDGSKFVKALADWFLRSAAFRGYFDSSTSVWVHEVDLRISKNDEGVYPYILWTAPKLEYWFGSQLHAKANAKGLEVCLGAKDLVIVAYDSTVLAGLDLQLDLLLDRDGEQTTQIGDAKRIVRFKIFMPPLVLSKK